MQTNFTYINTPEALNRVCDEWKQAQELGIDLECENNLHRYGTYISLIQVSTKEKHWIIDVLELKKIDPLLRLFKEPKIKKIFHDISFDVRILNSQFNCNPTNIFDTQLAALFLGKQEIGLGSLLEEYFGIVKERKYQMADWTKRPISLKMLTYAAKDTKYLIPLCSILKKELAEKKRLSWVEEELIHLEKQELKYQQGTSENAKGYKLLTDHQRAVLKSLFSLIEKLAKKADKPSYFIINTKKLLQLALEPLKTVEAWKNIRGVHPIVKKNAELFHETIKINEKEKIILKSRERKKFNPKQKEQIKKLSKLRDDLSEKFKIKKHLLLSQEQIRDIVINNNFKSLREWQKKLISHTSKKEF